ncbi:MAG: MoaD/ThiS family protein [bacterium]
MKIRLRLYAGFAEKMPSEVDEEGAARLSLDEGARIRDVLDRFQIPHEEAFIVLVNGRHARKDATLSEGEELCVFPAIVGG